MTRFASILRTPDRWQFGVALAGAAWLAGCASTPDNAGDVIARERLKLNVDRILPLPGRVVALAELYTTAGKAAPAR